MRQRLNLSGLAVLAVLLLTACQSTMTADTPMSSARESGWQHYGMSGYESGNAVALGAVGGGEQNVIVEGTITEVCPVKGCWMTVRDGDAELFVRFKDYSFFVPRNAAGHRVVMEGRAEAQVVSVDELRHYAQDAGKSAAEIAAITEPETRVTFYANSVYIEGEGLDEPYSQESS